MFVVDESVESAIREDEKTAYREWIKSATGKYIQLVNIQPLDHGEFRRQLESGSGCCGWGGLSDVVQFKESIGESSQTPFPSTGGGKKRRTKKRRTKRRRTKKRRTRRN
jgi:hypothetical protein